MDLRHRTITEAEWRAEGVRLFGDDVFRWRFVCPGCGGVQCAEDFREFTNNANAAYRECLGRYLPRALTRSWMNDKPRPGVRCDYAAFGFLKITRTIVTANDITEPVFEFDLGG